ncbi:MAG: FG-GAP-like repeat-containing protein [Candidatus Angelobacter sp.]
MWRHRNLGKAYYENPMTQLKAVDEFRAAMELTSGSPRDETNYGLALLRAGRTKEAIAELLKVQKEDFSIPHTWFNLGMAFKKEFDHQRAIEQLEGMLKLVPDEPVSHYNLGIEYKLVGKSDLALAQFETAARLNPNFAAPHFQLYNAYRETGQKDDAARELDVFNEIKKRKTGSAVAEDPEWSVYAEIFDKVELDEAFDRENAATPPFTFAPRKVMEGVEPGTAGMVVIDSNDNGKPDVLVWSRNGISILKNGSVKVENSGLEGLKDVVSVAPGDFNNDGLMDLAVVTTSEVRLYLNQGGKFTPYPTKIPSGTFTKALWVDYDHDYDLDLVLLGSKSVLLRNDGAAGFSDQTSRFPFVPGRALDAAMFDLFPDNSETDLAVLYDDGSIVVYHDKLLGHFEAQPLPIRFPGGSSIQAFDINNDGWTDLLLMTAKGVRLLINNQGKLTDQAGPQENGPVTLADLANRSLADLIIGNSVYRNVGGGKFEKSRTELPKSVAMAQADFDGDGRLDLAVVAPDGTVQVIKNQTATNNSFMGVRLEGVKNLKSALGAIVEAKTGAWYQKRIYQGVPLLFGIRSYHEADTLRITWPNGLVQNEIKEQAGREISYKEKPRLSGSCPMIFAWNGSGFQFITDVLGVAPLGASNGDGQYFPVNHREYIQLPSHALRTRNGKYEIRITEELREVSYLDKIQLIAVDHRSGEEVFTNDKFKGPPFPEFRLYGVKHKIRSKSARNQDGSNLLPMILKQDDRYASGFHCGSSGVADLHDLVLDFGTAAPHGRAVLFLNGWVDWADASTFVAASQQTPGGLVFPYLQVKDSAGNWQTVISDMGLPSGKPKTIAVDLTGKFLSQSREIKITTNLCVYWDEIFLSAETGTPVVRTTTAAADLAELHYRGFSAMTPHPGTGKPDEFEYSKWSATAMWNPTPGLYTRYGDVRQLVQHEDDQMVVMGAGDELRLLFSPERLPPLAPGWERSYLLLVDGWAKDSDSNTAYGKSVQPLPFHGMVSYPYPASQHFPFDARHDAYQKMFNIRPAVPTIKPLRSAN